MRSRGFWHVGMTMGLLMTSCSTGGIYSARESQRESDTVARTRQYLTGSPLFSDWNHISDRPLVTSSAETARPDEPSALPIAATPLSSDAFAFLELTSSLKDWDDAATLTVPKVVSERHGRLRALLQNQQIRSAWQTRVAANSRVSQALGLRRVAEQVDAFTRPPLEGREGALLPTSASTEGRVVAADIEVEQVRFEQRTYDLLERITNTFHDARYQRHAVRVYSRGVLVARRLVDASRARFGSNSASTTDVIRAEILREESERERDSAIIEERAFRRELGALLGSTDLARAGAPRPLPRLPQLSTVLESADQRSLMVRAARAKLSRGQAMLAMSEVESIPNRPPGISRGESVEPELYGSLSYPAAAPWLDELRSRVKALEHALASARHTSVAAAQMAHSQLSDALRTLSLYQRELVPRATQVLTTLELQYQLGRASYVELVDALREWLSTDLARYQASRAAAAAAARLETILGMPLSDVTSTARVTIPARVAINTDTPTRSH